MARYFWAFIPPTDLQQRVNDIRQIFADQYNSRKAFNAPPHITLIAPFSWPPSAKDCPLLDSSVTAAIAVFCQQQPVFPIQLSGFGAFAPRVIYVDVVRSPALLVFQSSLQELWHQISGIPTQARPFAPHMTVAFRDLNRASFRAAWPTFQNQAFTAEFMANAATLLRHNGQVWQPLQSFPLNT